MKLTYYLFAGLLLLVVFITQYFFFGPELSKSAQENLPQHPVLADCPQVESSGERQGLVTADYTIYRSLLLPIIAEHSDFLMQFGKAKGKTDPEPGAVILVTETISAGDFRNVPYADELTALKDQQVDGLTISNFAKVKDFETKISAEKFNDLSVVLASPEEIHQAYSSENDLSSEGTLGRSIVVRFSRIGLNCQGKEALVLISVRGGGWLVVLKFRNGVWKEELRKLIFMTIY